MVTTLIEPVKIPIISITKLKHFRMAVKTQQTTITIPKKILEILRHHIFIAFISGRYHTKIIKHNRKTSTKIPQFFQKTARLNISFAIK